MAKKGRDKRKAEWTLTDEIFDDIEECFRTTAAIAAALDTNSNTWRKISEDDYVKRSVARGIIHRFIDFLEKYRSGAIAPDSSKYNDRPIAKAIAKYVENEVEVDDLTIRKKD